jgi:hypothetical protein
MVDKFAGGQIDQTPVHHGLELIGHVRVRCVQSGGAKDIFLLIDPAVSLLVGTQANGRSRHQG